MANMTKKERAAALVRRVRERHSAQINRGGALLASQVVAAGVGVTRAILANPDTGDLNIPMTPIPVEGVIAIPAALAGAIMKPGFLSDTLLLSGAAVGGGFSMRKAEGFVAKLRAKRQAA